MNDLDYIARAAQRHRRPVVIEQTGKRWKSIQLGGGIWFVGGCAIMVYGSLAEKPVFAIGGLATVAVGAVIVCIGSMLAWWHHG